MYNILIFPGWFPSKENTLNAIFTKKHIDIISKTKNVIVVYAERTENQNEIYSICQDQSSGYPIITCTYKKSQLFFFKKVINFYRSIRAYLKAINTSRTFMKSIDFIHIHVLTKESIIPLVYKIFKGIPYFISEHSTEYLRPGLTSFLEKKFKIFLSKNSLGISAVSSSLKLAMEREGLKHNNFQVIHNAVSSDLFTLKPKLNHVKTKFLHVSRLDEKAKNVIGILEVFELLYSKYSNIELQIVGGQPNIISKAEIYSNKLSSKSSICFNGIKKGVDIVPYYHDSDFLVMFSNFETQAVVIMEALFCGMPVIATDLPCLIEYLHSGNSLLVKANDKKALFEKMELCINGKYEFWNGKEISTEINNVFNLAKIAVGFDNLYQTGFKK